MTQHASHTSHRSAAEAPATVYRSTQKPDDHRVVKLHTHHAAAKPDGDPDKQSDRHPAETHSPFRVQPPAPIRSTILVHPVHSSDAEHLQPSPRSSSLAEPTP